MLAVVPEDLPVPMIALELVWCSKRGVEPPLDRISLMKLRHHLFTLLNRNLLLRCTFGSTLPRGWGSTHTIIYTG